MVATAAESAVWGKAGPARCRCTTRKSRRTACRKPAAPRNSTSYGRRQLGMPVGDDEVAGSPMPSQQSVLLVREHQQVSSERPGVGAAPLAGRSRDEQQPVVALVTRLRSTWRGQPSEQQATSFLRPAPAGRHGPSTARHRVLSRPAPHQHSEKQRQGALGRSTRPRWPMVTPPVTHNHGGTEAGPPR